MSDLAIIEERLSEMERIVGEMQQRLNAMNDAPGWLLRFRGAFNDRPEFDDVARLGREFRETDKPRDESRS